MENLSMAGKELFGFYCFCVKLASVQSDVLLNDSVRTIGLHESLASGFPNLQTRDPQHKKKLFSWLHFIKLSFETLTNITRTLFIINLIWFHVLYNFSTEFWLKMLLLSVSHWCVSLLGRSIQNSPAVSVHGLARAGCAKIWWRLHWFHRSSAQNKRAVRSGWADHSTLQVSKMSLRNKGCISSYF